MLDYAVELTRQPASVGADDVDGLLAHGFSEAAILDICQVTAYYNYVNRLADGLGVELEGFWTDEELTMTAQEFEERTGHPPSESRS
jgi:hypothetical protein